MTRPWVADAIAAERRDIADLFETLTPKQLATPSLCDGWTVHDVAAHLTMMMNVSLPGLAFRIAGEQMSPARAIDRMTRQMAGRPIEGIVAQLRDRAEDRRHPPGRPLAPLADLVVHSEDVRRPLGMSRIVPFDRVDASMHLVMGGRTMGFLPAARVHGLQFVATDHDVSWGHGMVIHGPSMSLLLAAMGRRPALQELGGAVHVLAERIDPLPKESRATRKSSTRND